MQGASAPTTLQTTSMPRTSKPRPAELTLKPDDEQHVESPQPSPMNLQGIDLSSFGGDFSASLMNLPPLPQSPPSSPPLNRDSSKTFVTNFRTRNEQEQRADPPKRIAKDDDEYRPGSSSMSKIYHLRKHPGSTPELSLVGSAENVHKDASEVNKSQVPDTRTERSPQRGEDLANSKQKQKGFRNPLSRSKSIRRDSNSKSKLEKPSFEQPPKTAPLHNDWPGASERFLRAKTKDRRGKSAERAAASESEDNVSQERPQTKDKDTSFVSGSKNVFTKAKAGGGMFLTRLGKIGRSTSTHEKEIPDSEYVMKVINLPLVEQTRITRISKDLASCRDKTEYWMPSLPWRCIDYLNLNCESEGLYRVPGSGPQVKHWQRRFDSELDLDLLDEPELYDPNEIASMLKSWLRDLPSEIIPKAQQQALADEVAAENPEYQKAGQPAPQKLRNALSELPPFNYYLLFAITCHLSLLLANREKNKMDLNNLSICINPCLDLDRWLFNYLVGDWRNCWQGCYTEKKYLEAERAHEQGLEYQLPVPALGNSITTADSEPVPANVVDDRAVHSSSSNASAGISRQDNHSRTGRSPNRQNENSRPAGPGQSITRSVASPERKPVPSSEPKRPATAGEDKKQGESSKNLTPKTNATTHNRSQSDLPASPVQSSSPSGVQSQEQGQ